MNIHIDYTRLLYWNKFGKPVTVLSKFGDDRSALVYWWFDADKNIELKDAMDLKETLQPEKNEVIFDEIFSASKKIEKNIK